MEQVLFVISNLLIVLWIVFIFTNKNKKFALLHLSKRQVLWLIFVELILFTAICINYQITYTPSISDDFIWHNIYLYPRGMYPAAILSNILGNNISIIKMTIISFFAALTIDYLILLLFSKSKQLIASLKKV